MIESPEAAIRAMTQRARRAEPEEVGIEDALGRVLASGVVADRPSPPADVSAMDGFVLRAADASLGVLAVDGEIRIGTDPGDLPPGKAKRIVTGAAIPRGADAVVKVEDAAFADDRVTIPAPVAAALTPGTNVRRRGENLKAGQEAIAAGSLITPAVIGALATFGVRSVPVRKRVRAVVIVTGDELKSPGEDPTDHELRDSNGPAVSAVLAARAWIEVVGQARVGDDRQMIRTAMQRALERADVVVLTGGVSMGTRDDIPEIVPEVGAEIVFHRIPQRPGKPMLGAAMLDGRLIFGLPGNPVSALVTSRRIVVPVMAAMAGLEHAPPTTVTIADDDGATLDLWWHRLVRIVGPGRASLVAAKGSGDIPKAARSDGFVEIPRGAGGPGPWPMYFWS